MKRYKLFNNVFGWVSFLIAAVVYLLTIEPTVSFWDCGEFITTAFKFEVGHPPGAPIFMIVGRFFTLFGGPENAAQMVNRLSALASAGTILFLFWTITHLAKRLLIKNNEVSLGQTIAIVAAGLVGALSYTFSDTFWFSAVEGEVYASSSLLTALVFWAILKWEDVADEPFANRWLIFIAYIIGLSIGVHLLNLLAIPAIVFVYYFRKYEVTRKGIIWSTIISLALLGIIMYGIIPGFVTIASWFELVFVNTFGLPFHSGMFFYSAATIAVLVLGIHYTHKKKKVILNTLLLGVTVILIGYSSFAIIIIRSSAKPPMDQNSPNNASALLGYLNREQYGDRPLFSGQYYNSPLDPSDRYSEGRAIYSQIDGKYVVTHHRYKANYDPKFTGFLPRMWSSMDPTHADDYAEWGKIQGTRIQHKNERGETEVIVKPTFGENLRFFFNYQVNHMYWRYFMWNFVGRQNDIQGHGSVLNGNWLSGIKFIDEARLGDQDNLPAKYANNKARNTYYFLPFLFGLLGIFFQYNRGKEGKKGLWVVFLLFFLTGIAIVVYLNQYPHQPRERDYAYAGSFYAFAIWIGLGVLAITETLKKYIPETIAAGLTGIVALVLVPGIMGAQNWDDHDRSGRYTARDLGANYLTSCQPNSIIFTNGDNDTFPLWYNQEVEGVGTDIRVCNLSYLQTDWYIDQMRRKAYESEPVPFKLKPDQYRTGTRDAVYVLDNPRIKRDYVGLKEAVDFIADDNPATKLQQADGAAYIPKKLIRFKIDKEAVIKNKVVAPEDYDKIVDEIVIDLSDKNIVSKDEMMILDLLATNNWERPIYWAITVGRNKYLNLQDYFQLEGFAYRFVPIKSKSSPQQLQYGRVASNLMYDNLMNKFKWGGMNNPDVYLDETNTRMMTNIRNTFDRLASALILEGRKDSAIAVIDRCNELVPNEIIPYEYFAMNLAESYFKAGATDKGVAMIEKAFEGFNDELSYYFSLDAKFLQTRGINEEIQRNMFYMQGIERIARTSGQADLAKKISEALQVHFQSYNSTNS
jgi:tetratricopeptide (TPR) repeat protein